MRRTAIATLLLLALHTATAAAQTTADSAARVVDRFVQMTNIDAMSADSMLEAVTTVNTIGSTDTFTLRRWMATPQMQRIEVWAGTTLQTAYCTNGSTRYRMYKPDLGYWVDVEQAQLLDRLAGYDLRGPLHNWRSQGAELTYESWVTVKDRGRLQSVLVRTPGRYSRHYMFEPSGLLAVLIEDDELDTTQYAPFEAAHIKWKCIHEYQMAGSAMLPKTESFLRHGRLTVMQTEARMVRKDDIIFNSDNHGHTARP